MAICTVCGNYELDKEETCGYCGYDLNIVYKRVGNRYVEDEEATEKRNRPFPRIAYNPEIFETSSNRQTHSPFCFNEDEWWDKHYIDEDDMENDPDYWDNLQEE